MKKISYCFILMCVSFNILAAGKGRDAYISVLGGNNTFTFFEAPFERADAVAIDLGYMLTNKSAIQLSHTTLNMENVFLLSTGQNTSFLDKELSSLDYVYYKRGSHVSSPYWKFGMGLLEYNDAAEDDAFFGRIGLGYEHKFNRWFSGRLETNLIRDFENHRLAFGVFVGLTASFGGGDAHKKRSAPKPRVQPKPADTPKVSVPVRNDSDGDGVLDKDDQCPNTPKGAVVDTKGCEVDSDGDGVVDSKDACPGTPAGAKVDSRGCRIVLEETVRMSLDVKFGSNSGILLESHKADIQRVATFMRQYPDTSVRFEGHTDSMGKASYNQMLSEKRAKAVADELISAYGIDSSRVSSTGYGETSPIESNDTREGRAANRRVEALIETTVKKPQ